MATTGTAALGPVPYSSDLSVRPDHVVLTLLGELDLATCDVAGSDMTAAEAPGMRVVMDLSGVTFMCSTGLNLLLQSSGRLRGRGQTLELVPGDVCGRLIRLSGLEEHLLATAA